MSDDFFIAKIRFQYARVSFFIQSSPVCDAKIILEDLDTEQKIVLDGDGVMTDDASIVFDASLLTSNRRYITTITAINSAGQATSFTTLGKFVHFQDLSSYRIHKMPKAIIILLDRNHY